jgi:hypothetical protein
MGEERDSGEREPKEKIRGIDRSIELRRDRARLADAVPEPRQEHGQRTDEGEQEPTSRDSANRNSSSLPGVVVRSVGWVSASASRPRRPALPARLGHAGPIRHVDSGSPSGSRTIPTA